MNRFGPIVVLCLSVCAGAVQAVQFSYLDPNFTQEIYTGPLVGGPGMAWTSTNNLLTKSGSNILEYSLVPNTTYQGTTTLHGVIATHPIAGLSAAEAGLVKAVDGYLYAPTSGGVQRINPNNWAAPAVTMPNTVYSQGYGITALPDGRIAYIGGASTNEVHLFNPSNNTDTLIYTAPSLIDDIEANSTGQIALAAQISSGIIIIQNTGAVINSFSSPHYPDGLAFGDGVTYTTLYSNNNDGTISQYVLGPGYTGVPVITDIATGSGAYGDLAAVGPDCALYISQFDNGGYHGSTPGVGTNWDNNVTTNEASIIRIAGVDRTGAEYCAFNYMLEDTPEPVSGAGMLLGAAVLLRRGRGG